MSIKTRFSILLIMLVVFVAVLFFVKHVVEEKQKLQAFKTQSQFPNAVRFGDTKVIVTRADTDTLRKQGLSGTNPLLPNHGMLFIFPFPGKYAFWMKNMNYAIDIIWLDANQNVVFTKEHATPESYPALFAPTEDALYVLEVPDGFIQEHHITRDTPVIFE